MSGEGIGEAVVGLMGGAVVLVGYGIAGAAWLTYHGVRGAVKLAVGAGKMIHSAYVANEERRRAKALEELKAIDGVMARSTESLLMEIRAAEEESEKLRAAEIKRMDAEWDATLTVLESKKDAAAEALLGLHEFHKKRAAELTASLTEATRDLDMKLDAACDAMCERTMKSMESAAAETRKKLEEAGLAIEERQARYMDYARRSLAEAESVIKWVEANYDCDGFADIGVELVAAKSQLAALKEAIASGAAAGASSNAAMAVSAAQQLVIRAERCTTVFNRAKASVDEAVANLMEVVESSRILLPEGSPEELQDFVSEEMDAAFWSEGRLEKLWKEAQTLQARADAFGPRDEAVGIVHRAQELRLQVMSEYTRTRMHVLGKNEVIQLAKKVIEGHAANGWELTEDPSYLGGDCRRDLRLRFEKNGDTRVVIVMNNYNAAIGLYEQQIMRFADEAGMPDEEERRREDEAINSSMSELGVDERLHVVCDSRTAGQKLQA